MLPPPLCTREESVDSLQFLGNQTATEDNLRRRKRGHITVPHKGDFEIHYLSSYVPPGTQGGLWPVLTESKVTLINTFLIRFLTDCTPSHIPSSPAWSADLDGDSQLLCSWASPDEKVAGKLLASLWGTAPQRWGWGHQAASHMSPTILSFWQVSIISKYCMAASSNSWGWAKRREEMAWIVS